MTDQRDRARGALLGLAVGDALGAPFEFKPRGSFICTDMVGGGTWGLDAGYWTDDTSMALCLADSLLAYPEFEPIDCMLRFARWLDTGYNSSTGSCFDVGTGTAKAIKNFKACTNAPAYCTSTSWAEPDSAGNGCIMRLAPVPILWHRNPYRASVIATDQARTTHESESAIGMVTAMAITIAELIRDRSSPSFTFAIEQSKHRPLSAIKSDGLAKHTLQAALWSIAQTSNFRDALLTAVNLGDDTDTVGAVTGQLAGAMYGMEGIPREWLAKLHDRARIQSLADRLFNRLCKE